MVLQSLLLIAGVRDNVQQTQNVGGRSNGAAEPVADCFPRLVIVLVEAMVLQSLFQTVC